MATRYGYRKHNIEKEFASPEELMDYLETMDSVTEQAIRYWYVTDCFDQDDLVCCLADGDYKDMTRRDWLEEAINHIEDQFLYEDGYDWTEDTICGVYVREADE